MNWTFWRRRERVLTEEHRAALKRVVADALFELIPLKAVLEKAEALPPGSCATVTASPSHGIESTFDVCEALVARGHDAVPHLSAHMIRDAAHLSDLLDRARAAGLTKAFVVGGDAKDRGAFHDGLHLLRAMDQAGHPFREIGVPCYPEGHVAIDDATLLQALKDKQPFATSMTTQMGFNPGAVTAWLTRMRAEGVTLPLVLGVPGVAELTKLMAISARIGIADSARYLQKNKKMVGHLMRQGSFGPDAYLEALAPTIADPAMDVRGIHIFTFNQVEQTAAWQRAMLDGTGPG
jgi:methylenetetrahydrofolate reductase (NADPH)